MPLGDTLANALGGGLLGTLVVRLTADSTKLVAGMRTAETAVDAGTTVMMRRMALLGTAATAALAVVGGAAVRAAMKFEDSFTGVRKTVDATAAEFAKLEETFREMSKQIPVTVNEINRIGEAAGALGIPMKDIAAFTKVMADMGATTNLSSDEASSAFARIANVMGNSGEDFARMGATVVALGQSTAATESEITEMATRLAGAGSVIKLSTAQVLGLAASLSSVGVNAEAGGTAMSQTMIKMAKAISSGGEELKLFAEAIGVSSEALTKMWKEDATGAMISFLEGLKRMSDEGRDVFGFIDKLGMDGARMTAILLQASGAGEKFRQWIESGSKAWKENTALVDAANKRYNTFSSQLKITGNLFNDLLITVGQSLLPTMVEFNKLLQEAIKWIAQTQEETGFLTATFKTIIDVFKVFALGGMVVWTVLSSLATLIASYVVVDLKILGSAIDSVIKISGFWWEAIKGVRHGLIQLAGSALDVSKVMMSLAERDFKGAAIAAAKMLAGGAKGFAEITNSVQKAVAGSSKEVAKVITDSWDTARAVGEGAVEDLKKQWGDLLSFGEKLFPVWDGGFKVVAAAVKTVAKETKDLTDKNEDLTKSYREMANAQRDVLQRIGLQTPLEEMGMADKESIENLKAAGVSPETMMGLSKVRRYPKGGVPDATGLADPFASQSMGLTKEIQEAENRVKILNEINLKEGDQFEELENRKLAAIEAYNQKIKQLYQAQTMIILSAYQDAFSSVASVTEGFAGKQSNAYKAMFAASKAFAIAEASIKIMQGIATAAAGVWPQNIIAMASVAAATAGIVGNIQSVALAMDAKAKGGPVTAGKSFLVGEKGPEIFSPSSNGMIIPNDKISSAASSGAIGGQVNQSVRVIINNFTDAKPEVSERSDGEGKIIDVVIRRVKREISSEVRDGRGDVSKAMESTFGLKRGKV